MSINGGFTLGGLSARSLGITMLRTSQRPVLPDTVDRTLVIPGRNGAYDFGADLGPRPFNLECVLIKRTPVALQQAISTLAAFLLDQYAKPKVLELVFDLQPDRTYYVRYVGSLAIDRVVGLGRFTLPLMAFDPYAYSGIDINDQEYLYDTGLDYDDGLYYPNSRMVQDYAYISPGLTVPAGDHRRWTGFVWNYTNQYSTQMNYSNLFIPMVMRISGTVVNPTIRNEANGKEMSFNLTLDNDELLVDCGRFRATVNGSNALPSFSGDFIGLSPGENQFLYTGLGPNASVTYLWRHKFI